MSKQYTTFPYTVIISALDKLEAYVRPTYGPAGRGILVDVGGYQKMLDDGYLAIDEFELDDPLENAVIKFVRAASFQANKRAGDGTTTATLLMIAIVREILRASRYDAVGVIEKPLHFALEDLSVGSAEAIGNIYQARRLITEESDLLGVAFNAYRDGDMAEMVSKVVKEVGPDGVVTVEGSEALETTCEVVVGMNIPQGFYSPYLAGNESKVEIANPAILITTERITSNAQLLPILQKVIASGKRELLIVCDSMDGEALTTLIMNRTRGNLNAMVVKSPFQGQAKLDFLEDLAIVTASNVVDEVNGLRVADAGLGSLGTASKVVVTKDSCLIVRGAGQSIDIDPRADIVRALLVEQPNNDAIATRLARLTGGIGVIKVGANTEAEIKTKKAKVEDAVHATQLAYKTGVVAGGAKAFMVETSSDELNAALKFPREVLEANGTHYLSDDAEDAFGVVQAAIESAVSIATLLLNCGGIITEVNGNKT